MPKLGEKLDREHLLEIVDPARPAGAALEADDALDRSDMVEPPAAKVVLEIDEFFGKLIKPPMRFRRAVDLGPCRLDGGIGRVGGREIPVQDCLGQGEGFRQKPKRHVVKRRLCKLRLERGQKVGAVGVGFEHSAVAVAQHEFDEPVLPALKARRLPQ